MTVILVLAMCITALIIDGLIQKRRAALRTINIDERDLLYNHMWLRHVNEGMVDIGIDEFSANAIGRIQSVDFANVGSDVARRRPLATLRRGQHSVTLEMPFDGTVVRTNQDLVKDPSLITSDPLGRGWMVRVKTDHLQEISRFRVANPVAWLRQETDRLSEFLNSRRPEVAMSFLQDGGTLVHAVLDQFDDETWNAFSRKFLTVPDREQEPGRHV